MNTTDTMILYHFLNAKYGLAAIRTRKLKISLLKDLNDPFEFLSVNLSDREFRKALEQEKEKMLEVRGVLCFSETWQDPVLWGHYADKHKGICLGFRVPKSIINKVNYVASRLASPKNFNGLNEKLMRRIICTKFEHWGYEQEYRIWISLNKKEIDGLYYADFSTDFSTKLTLTNVIVGCNSSITRAKVSEALGDRADSVKTFKARASFKEFKVVRNRNSALWS